MTLQVDKHTLALQYLNQRANTIEQQKLLNKLIARLENVSNLQSHYYMRQPHQMDFIVKSAGRTKHNHLTITH